MHYKLDFENVASASITSEPDERNMGGDHPDHDEHPILAFETQNGERLNQKLSHFGPQFLRKIGVLVAEIYYSYIERIGRRGPESPGRPTLSRLL
jgi:hypothetical protein